MADSTVSATPTTRQKPFAVARVQLDKVAALMELSPSLHRFLGEAEQELHVTIPVKMEGGETKVFKGFRVRHSGALGPAKGGIRFHPEETVDTIRALAMWMSWKCALLGLPLGGGKGGVICDPKELSQAELERLSRAYMDRIWTVAGPDLDVPAPDVYTTPQIMVWMMDEYEKLSGGHAPGVITGKTVLLGGSLGREDATGRGTVYAAREAARSLGIDTGRATMAIQGFGNAGQWVAILARELLGVTIVAASDTRGGVYNPGGLDPRALQRHKRATSSVAGFPGSQHISDADLLALDVDVLVPAAMEEAITAGNAHAVRARIVAEAANGPVTPEADDILHARGVFDIPDILCSAGGVTVSYFEMVQNATGYYWDLDEVHRRLDARMTSSFRTVLERSRDRGVDMRTAALMVAVSRVADAVAQRGWV